MENEVIKPCTWDERPHPKSERKERPEHPNCLFASRCIQGMDATG